MQLHEVVDAVTADEPPMGTGVDEIVTAGRKAERNRRAGFATAGAAGLVAIAVAGAFALPSHNAGPGVDAAAAPVATTARFSFTFGAYDAGKLHVQKPTDVSGAYEVAAIKVNGGKEKYGSLTVYQPGAFDIASIKKSRTVTVGGHQVVDASLTVDKKDKVIAWQYKSGAWAVVGSFSDTAADPSFADLAGLVAGFKPSSSPAEVVLPFTLGYLPAGYTAVEASEHSAPGWDSSLGDVNGDLGGATFTQQAAPTTGLAYPYQDKDLPGGFTVRVSSLGATGQTAPTAESLREKCELTPKKPCPAVVIHGDTEIVVSGGLSTAEKTKVAQSIKLADVTDDSTWIPATRALQP